MIQTIDMNAIAVITGGSSGMGLACARLLGKTHALLIADINDASLETATAELRAAGCTVTPVRTDISQPDSVAELAKTSASLGRFAALVHAAGVSPTMTDARRVMEVNLIGAALVERAFLELATPGSAAVLIASTAGHMASERELKDPALLRPLADDFWTSLVSDISNPAAAYITSKCGVMRYCEVVAPEWGARGARITTISPGVIETPMGKREFAEQPMMAQIVDISPVRRWGRADEIASTAAFLLSEQASFITGTDIRVDGGSTPVLKAMIP